MKFPCPKCGMADQVGLTGKSLRRHRRKCRTCGATIVTRRMTTVGGNEGVSEVCCGNCGRKFSVATECPFCKTAFSGFLLVCAEEASHVVKNRIRKHGGKGDPPGLSPGKAPGEGQKEHRFRLVVGAALVILLLAMLSLGMVKYRDLEAEKAYPGKYVVALYGIESGFDRGNSFGRRLLPGPSLTGGADPDRTVLGREEQDELDTVRVEVDRLMEELRNPPDALRDAGQRLTRLYAVYREQDQLVRRRLGSPADYDGLLRKAEHDFSRTLAELKSGLPGLLREEVKTAGIKYNLKFME